MEIAESQYLRIADGLPRQRGNVSLTHLQVLNAILYAAEQGRKWRGLPRHFGNWHTIYTRMNRWSKAGVLDRIFVRLQREQVIALKIEAVSLDSATIKAHPDGAGALKKRSASHRPLPRGSRHQDSSGCRGCSARPEFLAFPGSGRGRAARARTLAGGRAGSGGLPSTHGSAL